MVAWANASSYRVPAIIANEGQGSFNRFRRSFNVRWRAGNDGIGENGEPPREGLEWTEPDLVDTQIRW
jgi:hypothetical protein